jgi:hypothetical protein
MLNRTLKNRMENGRANRAKYRRNLILDGRNGKGLETVAKIGV